MIPAEQGVSASGHDGSLSGHVRWGSVVLFILLAFALSWGIEIGLRPFGVSFGIRATAAMFCPAIAALLVGALLREGFADLGLRLSSRGHLDRTYFYAFAVPPALLAGGLLLSLLVGYQHWALLQNYTAALSRLPRADVQTIPPLVAIGVNTLAALTLAPLLNAILGSLGEELGWRGHLLARLGPLGEAKAAVLVGVVWGLWHAPVIALDGYNYPGHPWIGPFFFFLTVPLSVILSWMRLRSGSVFPAAIAHGAINAQAGFGLLALSRGDPLIAPPTGIIGIVPLAAAAVWLVATGRLTGRGTPGRTPRPDALC